MAHPDSLFYYKVLGLPETASAEQIRNAYRKRAKEFHPDTNAHPDAKRVFQLLNEAHQTLGSTEKRAAYDAEQYAKAREAKEKIEPTRCSCCKAFTAQPRYAVFWRAISAVVVSTRNPTQGIYCASCARKTAFRDTLVSAAFGWWGFPYGPIFTISSIFNNALGRYNKEVEQSLLWWNALAFAQAGNLALSLALADKVRAAKGKMAGNAATLISNIRQTGFDDPIPQLADPWKLRISVLVGHSLAASFAPALVCLLLSSSTASSSKVGTNYSYLTPTTFAPAPTMAPAVAQVPVVNVKKCIFKPLNGAILDSHTSLGQRGHILEIQNGSGGDAIIKIKDAYSKSLVMSFLVYNNSTASIDNLPDGYYQIQYAFGDIIAENCKSFVTKNGFGQFPDTEHFETRYEDNSIIHQRLSYTLYPVPGGNVRPQTVAESEFDQD